MRRAIIIVGSAITGAPAGAVFMAGHIVAAAVWLVALCAGGFLLTEVHLWWLGLSRTPAGRRAVLYRNLTGRTPQIWLDQAQASRELT